MYNVTPVLTCFCLDTGATLTLGTLVYGAYAYRFRGAMSTSRYLMRLRVVSQGAIVMAMVIGAAWTTRKITK